MTAEEHRLSPAYRPLYLQIREALTQRLASGDWPPGVLLPSETALAQEYGVSQGTIRKALDAMAAERLVVRHQGRGTEVARHTNERSLFQFFHIYGDDDERRLPTSRVLECSRGRARQDEAKELGLRAGAPVVRIFRVRDLSDRPAMTEWITVSAELFPDLEHAGADLPNAIYELYQRDYRITVQRAVERLYAVAADERDAELLGIKIGTPLLHIRRTAFDLEHRPVELRISRCLTTHQHYLNDLV
ncbi:MAG: GntR family transcriptional regulator [Aquisalimonadaceae bacterium]